MSINYGISTEDLIKFTDAGKKSERLLLIWSDLLTRIKDSTLRREAREKGFTLRPYNKKHRTTTPKIYQMEVQEGSSQLKAEVRRLNNIISIS